MTDGARGVARQDGALRGLEKTLREKRLIPLLGRGAISIGDDDRPLYPWLVEEVAGHLDIAPEPASLHYLVAPPE